MQPDSFAEALSCGISLYFNSDIDLNTDDNELYKAEPEVHSLVHWTHTPRSEELLDWLFKAPCRKARQIQAFWTFILS